MCFRQAIKARTGANFPVGTVGGNTDLWGRMAWLEDYCRRNPLEMYINALTGLRGYLMDHRQ
jgi:hypothetical protein